jgi:hypothetical protein
MERQVRRRRLSPSTTVSSLTLTEHGRTAVISLHGGEIVGVQLDGATPGDPRAALLEMCTWEGDVEVGPKWTRRREERSFPCAPLTSVLVVRGLLQYLGVR